MLTNVSAGWKEIFPSAFTHLRGKIKAPKGECGNNHGEGTMVGSAERHRAFGPHHPLAGSLLSTDLFLLEQNTCALENKMVL